MKSIYIGIFILLFMASCREQNETVQPKEKVGNCEINKNAPTYFVGNFGGSCLSYTQANPLKSPYRSGVNSNSFATCGTFPTEDGPTAVYVAFSYIVATPIATQAGRAETEEYPLVVGKQKWGHFDRMPCAIERPSVEGVYIQYSKEFGGAWLTSVADQPEDSYFEITKITPHETDPNRIWVSGKFSCLMYQMGSEGKYGGLKLKDAEFRTAILKPDYVYQRYFGK